VTTAHYRLREWCLICLMLLLSVYVSVCADLCVLTSRVTGRYSQVKTLEDELGLLDAQITAQKDETQAAKDTLGDAAKEMEAISFEKKQLLQQWKTSVVGMSRRDEALTAVKEQLRTLHEEMQSAVAEVDGYRASIAAEQARNEALHDTMIKLENETKFLQEQLSKSSVARESLAERFAMLKTSLEQVDKELDRQRQVCVCVCVLSLLSCSPSRSPSDVV
jgi:chromosome segregation ATPase